MPVMGDEIQELVDLDATADRILGLLDVSDTVLLLCHGVLSRQSNEMSLMVASDDSLPTQHVIAAASPSERTHRLDWRLLREIEAPYVVFSRRVVVNTSPTGVGADCQPALVAASR